MAGVGSVSTPPRCAFECRNGHCHQRDDTFGQTLAARLVLAAGFPGPDGRFWSVVLSPGQALSSRLLLGWTKSCRGGCPPLPSMPPTPPPTRPCGSTGIVYQHGLRGIWYAFFSAWCAISAFVSTRIFRRSLAYTQAEWQSLRFSGLGSELLRGWMAGWSVFMNMFVLGWVGIAMGKICNVFFNWPEWVGLIVFLFRLRHLRPGGRLLGRGHGRLPAGRDCAGRHCDHFSLGHRCRRGAERDCEPVRCHGRVVAAQSFCLYGPLQRGFPGGVVHHHDGHRHRGRRGHGNFN